VTAANLRRAKVSAVDEVQRDVILDALDDAVEYRHDRGGRACGECEAAPDGLCADHGADLERARRGAAAAAGDRALTTLIAPYNSEGCVGRCDAKCCDAAEPGCDYICHGRNHGAGKQHALDNTRELAESWIEQARSAGQDITRVTLRRGAKSSTKRVHVLVMLAFKGRRPPGMHILHRDDDQELNDIESLRYWTQAENEQEK
jgi:hypothetical protein